MIESMISILVLLLMEVKIKYFLHWDSNPKTCNLGYFGLQGVSKFHVRTSIIGIGNINKRFYVLPSSPTGHFFYSDDGYNFNSIGTSFSPINDICEWGVMRYLYIAPANPFTACSIQRSTNGINFYDTNSPVGMWEFVKALSDKIVAFNRISLNFRVYHSTDGINFNMVGNTSRFISDMIVDANRQYIYAIFSLVLIGTSSIKRTADGVNWEDCEITSTSSENFFMFRDEIYVLITTNPSHIYKLSDDGITFEEITELPSDNIISVANIAEDSDTPILVLNTMEGSSLKRYFHTRFENIL